MTDRSIRIEVKGARMDLIYNVESWEMARNFLKGFVSNLEEKSFENLSIYLTTSCGDYETAELKDTD